MVEYTCPRCGHITRQKGDMRKHLYRKKICKNILSNINISDLKESILNNECKIFQNPETIEELKKQITILKDENKELQKQLLLSNNTTNNYNIVLSFNETNTDFLKDTDYRNSINKMIMSVPDIIKKIHFNPEHPENHNVYIPSIRENRAMIYDGIKWNADDRNKIIDDLIYNYESKLVEWVEDEGDEEMTKQINTYIEKREGKGVLEHIKKEIKYILYNNKSMICQPG